jgi:hypothetical protein
MTPRVHFINLKTERQERANIPDVIKQLSKSSLATLTDETEKTAPLFNETTLYFLQLPANPSAINWKLHNWQTSLSQMKDMWFNEAALLEILLTTLHLI